MVFFKKKNVISVKIWILFAILKCRKLKTLIFSTLTIIQNLFSMKPLGYFMLNIPSFLWAYFISISGHFRRALPVGVSLRHNDLALRVRALYIGVTDVKITHFLSGVCQRVKQQNRPTRCKRNHPYDYYIIILITFITL